MNAPAQCSSGHPDLRTRDHIHYFVDKITPMCMLYTLGKQVRS
jgi:hypothetical protein